MGFTHHSIFDAISPYTAKSILIKGGLPFMRWGLPNVIDGSKPI